MAVPKWSGLEASQPHAECTGLRSRGGRRAGNTDEVRRRGPRGDLSYVWGWREGQGASALRIRGGVFSWVKSFVGARWSCRAGGRAPPASAGPDASTAVDVARRRRRASSFGPAAAAAELFRNQGYPDHVPPVQDVDSYSLPSALSTSTSPFSSQPPRGTAVVSCHFPGVCAYADVATFNVSGPLSLNVRFANDVTLLSDLVSLAAVVGHTTLSVARGKSLETRAARSVPTADSGCRRGVHVRLGAHRRHKRRRCRSWLIRRRHLWLGNRRRRIAGSSRCRCGAVRYDGGLGTVLRQQPQSKRLRHEPTGARLPAAQHARGRAPQTLPDAAAVCQALRARRRRERNTARQVAIAGWLQAACRERGAEAAPRAGQAPNTWPRVASHCRTVLSSAPE
jgi:hypothetical protein